MSKTQSPVGIAQYPHLDIPDTKFSEGDYKVSLTVPADQAQGFIAEIEEAQEAEVARQKALNPKWKSKMADLPFGEDDNGNILFKFKVGAEGKYGSRKPAFYNAKGKPTEPVAVGGGSKIRMNVTLYSWMTPTLGVGVTLQPTAVQVIDFVAKGSGGGEGFSEVDGDYEGQEADQGFAEQAQSKATPKAPVGEDEDF